MLIITDFCIISIQIFELFKKIKVFSSPNFAEKKQKKPRPKALNYKARIVTKDLFADRINKKDENTKE
jgi:hypothetical protein